MYTLVLPEYNEESSSHCISVKSITREPYQQRWANNRAVSWKYLNESVERLFLITGCMASLTELFIERDKDCEKGNWSSTNSTIKSTSHLTAHFNRINETPPPFPMSYFNVKVTLFNTIFVKSQNQCLDLCKKPWSTTSSFNVSMPKKSGHSKELIKLECLRKV